MYNFLVVFQMFMVLGCFIFVIIMTRQRESMLSKLMLCIGFLGVIQNAGYLLELLFGDIGEAMIAVRVVFLGGAHDLPVCVCGQVLRLQRVGKDTGDHVSPFDFGEGSALLFFQAQMVFYMVSCFVMTLRSNRRDGKWKASVSAIAIAL